MCLKIQKNVKDFKALEPVVSIMCNKGLRGRHWEEMSENIGFDITPDSGTTLRKMLKNNLDPVLTQFEGGLNFCWAMKGIYNEQIDCSFTF